MVVSTSCCTAGNYPKGSEEWDVGEAFMRTGGAWTGAEPQSVEVALQTVPDGNVALMNHQKAHRDLSGPGSSIHSHGSLKPVTAMELLFGFSNHVVELSYLGYCFVNSDVLDSLSAAFNFAMGFGCWFATAPKGVALAVSATATSATALKVAAAPLPPAPVSQAMLLWSYAMEQRLQSYSISHMVLTSPTLPASAAQLFKPVAAADLALVVYAKAGQIRQRLLLVWMLLVILVLQLCARRHVVVPTMMAKVWSQLGWSQNMSAALALSLKAWMYQVPFLLFVPLITAEIASHVLCAVTHKMPPELIAVRFGPALLLAFAVSALRNIYNSRVYDAHHGF
eukprot:gene12055-12197_t